MGFSMYYKLELNLKCYYMIITHTFKILEWDLQKKTQNIRSKSERISKRPRLTIIVNW